MSRVIWAFALFWFFVVQATDAWACPHCNIHNYLAESVKNSTNIYVGKLIRQIDGYTAEVEVIRVIRGNYQPGSKVKADISHSPTDSGESYLFSDPKHSLGPTYEALPLEYEDEVHFLVQDNPKIADLAEAIKRVQGISKVTKEAGFEYLQRNPEDASEALMASIREVRTSFLAGKIENFGAYRLSNLVEALMIAPTKESQEFLFQETEDLLAGESQAIFMVSESSFESERGEYLQAILLNIAKDKELQKKFRSSILEKIPNLQDQTLVDVAYALAHSNTASPEIIAQKIEGREQGDAIALGLLSAGNRKARIWDFEDAFANWDPALEIAADPKIKQWIKKRIDDCNDCRPATKASKFMGYWIFFLPIVFFAFTRRARIAFLISATFGTFILCMMLYLDAHESQSPFDHAVRMSMLLGGAVFVAVSAIEVLILKWIAAIIRRVRNSDGNL